MVRAHAESLFPILSDPGLHTFTGGSPPQSHASLAEIYGRRESRRSPDGNEFWLNWLIRERELGAAIGYAQATISSLQTLVAWVIGASWQRRGYGSEAVQGLVAWLDILGAPEIQARVHPGHTASQKVAYHAGLRPASRFVDGEEVWIREQKERRTAMKLQLVPPTVKCRESFLRGLLEFRNEGLPWWVGGDLETAEHDFAGFVASKLAESNRRTETLVPKTHLWAVTEEQFVGRISIHHELNAALRIEGGHIGYDTVASFRGRGVATEMLRQALPLARALGLTEVLLTCDDTNVASIRVIEKNGGSLWQTKVLETNRPLKRYYWITLT